MDNIVVEAGSVVTKSFFESNIIIGGNPAKIISIWERSLNKNFKYAKKHRRFIRKRKAEIADRERRHHEEQIEGNMAMEMRVCSMMDLLASEVCGKTIDKSQYAFTDDELVKLYKLSKTHDLAHLIGDTLIKNDLIRSGEVQ